MVAVALSAIALAASAGCAGQSDLGAQFQSSLSSSAYAAAPSRETMPAPEGAALQMALATEAASAGPTPAYATTQNPDHYETLRGLSQLSEEGPAPLALSVGLSAGHGYGPSTALVAMPGSGEWQPLEISIAGPAASSGLDFSVSRRAGSEQGPNGQATTAGAELRIGQRLTANMARFRSPSSWSQPAWYIFAASDGQALTYTPSNDPEALNRNFRLQDRVNIGDIQAGISMEAAGLQASLSYVQREVTTMDVIRHEERSREDFTGLTLTWRR